MSSRVLMLGHCHSVFVHPLAVHLRGLRDLDFSVLELLAPGAEVKGVDPVYTQTLRPPPSDDSWTVDLLSGAARGQGLFAPAGANGQGCNQGDCGFSPIPESQIQGLLAYLRKI